MGWWAAGIAFAALWSSAATATKLGLTVAQPLVIAVVRFGLAALLLLFMAHVVFKSRLPSGKEWKQVAVYGLLNITIYLGCYVIAMQTVTAGIGALAVATNPVFISFFSIFLLKQKLTTSVLFSLIICTAGVVIAAWPLLGNAEMTTGGLLILLFSMVSYSLAAIYFSSRQWNGLSLMTINGWQTLLGGLFLLPVGLITYKDELNHFNITFWSATWWLALPVSVIAVQLWLWLLEKNTVGAGLFLFLCPLFGFIIAAWWMKENISGYTLAGVLLVMMGLGLSKMKKVRDEATVN